MGGAAGCDSDAVLADRLRALAEESALFEEHVDRADLGGSEDCTYFMERVQQRGGLASYMVIGSEIAAGHHDSRFDFDENVMPKAIALVATAAVDLVKNPIAR